MFESLGSNTNRPPTLLPPPRALPCSSLSSHRMPKTPAAANIKNKENALVGPPARAAKSPFAIQIPPHVMALSDLVSIRLPRSRGGALVKQVDYDRIKESGKTGTPLPTNIVSFDYVYWASKIHDAYDARVAFLPLDTWTKFVLSPKLSGFDSFTDVNLSHQHMVFFLVKVDNDAALAVIVGACRIGGEEVVRQGDEGLPYAERARAQEACQFDSPQVLVFCPPSFKQKSFKVFCRRFMSHFVPADRRGELDALPYQFVSVSSARWVGLGWEC